MLDQLSYRPKQQRYFISSHFLRRAVALLTFLGAWQLLVATRLLNPLFVASPSAIGGALADLWSTGTYQQDLLASLGRVAVGFACGSVAAIACAYVLATTPLLEDIVDWSLHAARHVSPLALVPLTVLWLGTGEPQKYALIGITVFFPVLINTYGAVRATPVQILRGAQTLGCRGRWSTFRYVVMPMSAPAIFTALRVGLAMAFLVIVAAEMIGASSGIGYLILTEGELLNTPAVFVGIVTVGVLGVIVDRLLLAARKRACPWFVEVR